MALSAYPTGDPGHVAHLPVRTCVGCRQRDEQKALLRVVAMKGETDSTSWDLHPDESRRRGGRGAYVHHDLTCAGLAIQRRAFERALKIQGVLLGDRLMAALEQQSS
ncbi:YlxR family protein [Ornithinimicrobium sp. Arc0846-15]|nr:YlxR family protein [Ornithinimicrobium laminariae]